jgi:hypothetical protein
VAGDAWLLDLRTYARAAPAAPHSHTLLQAQPRHRLCPTHQRALFFASARARARLSCANARLSSHARGSRPCSSAWTLLRVPGPVPPARKMHAAVFVSRGAPLLQGCCTGFRPGLWAQSSALQHAHSAVAKMPSVMHVMCMIGLLLVVDRPTHDSLNMNMNTYI